MFAIINHEIAVDLCRIKNDLFFLQAKAELRKMLLGPGSVDRWAAAQCLAHFGECDSDVVAEIIKQILSTEVAVKLEQGIHLLANISNSSVSRNAVKRIYHSIH